MTAKAVIPLRAENPTGRTPYVVIGLIAINVVCWLVELSLGVDAVAMAAGAIPKELVGRVDLVGPALAPLPDGASAVVHHAPALVPWPLTAVTTQFLHRDWLHLVSNMWFLWLFGDNVEDALGHVRFAAFYLLCGVVATAAHVAIDPQSQLPLIGASGAIAGALGGYAVLYPRARVLTLVFLLVFFTWVEVPAWLWLGFWFIQQFFTSSDSGVAWMAHVGGFVAGAGLVLLFAGGRPRRPRRCSA
jgi:membrane associated rhomboid family serine protease